MIKSGDLVRINPERKMKRTDFFTVTSQAGRIYDPNNKMLGKFMSDDVALIVSMYYNKETHHELALVITSGGLLGWVVASPLVCLEVTR